MSGPIPEHSLCQSARCRGPSSLALWPQVFSTHQVRQHAGLIRMMQVLRLKTEGKVHSGIDDARNIARISLALMHDGAEAGVTSQVLPHGLPRGGGGGALLRDNAAATDRAPAGLLAAPTPTSP